MKNIYFALLLIALSMVDAFAEPKYLLPAYSIEKSISKSLSNAKIVVLGRLVLPYKTTIPERFDGNRAIFEMSFEIDKVIAGEQFISGIRIPVSWVIPMPNPDKKADLKKSDADLRNAKAMSFQLEKMLDANIIDRDEFKKRSKKNDEIILYSDAYLKQFVLMPIAMPISEPCRDVNVLVTFGDSYILILQNSKIYGSFGIGLIGEVDVYPAKDEKIKKIFHLK